MAKVTLGATIPVAQYANLTPQVEIEADTTAEAIEIALREIKSLWDRVGKAPLEIRGQGPQLPPDLKTLTCVATGTQVLFDPVAHEYYSLDGSQGWLSGSAFADEFSPEFPRDIIAGKMALKYDVPASKIIEMWELNAQASRTVGTAVHLAQQLRGEYGSLSRAIAKEGEDPLKSALTKNPILRPLVDAWFAQHGEEEALYEVFVAHEGMKLCGQVDRIKRLPDGRVVVQDWKSNANLDKEKKVGIPFKDIVPQTEFGGYVLQLSFYALILRLAGWDVSHLEILHWTGKEWDVRTHHVVDILEIADEFFSSRSTP